MEQGNMNRVLRRVSVVMGIILLFISIYWSQDGFNFNVAGDAGGTSTAVLIGWSLAIAVTVIEFVFSTNLKELNASLIVFGLLAYGYSIYTNYQGIRHFQGTEPNTIMAWVLGFCMDGVPEPLIAWGLAESLTGDFVGNLFKGFGAFITGKPLGGKSEKSHDDNKGHNKNSGGNGQHGNQGNHQGKQAPQLSHREQRLSQLREELRTENLEKNRGFHMVGGNNRENRQDSDKFRR